MLTITILRQRIIVTRLGGGAARSLNRAMHLKYTKYSFCYVASTATSLPTNRCTLSLTASLRLGCALST